MVPTYTPELLAALGLFAFAASITPGPNNSLLLASGANFGLRASLPLIAGVVIGYVGLIALCGLGVAAVFDAFPPLREGLKWGGAAYMIYLAWKIATTKGIGSGARNARPLNFAAALAFQTINPKGWVIALATVSTYVPARGFLANLLVALAISAGVSVAACFTWAAFGVGLQRVISRPHVLRAFNVGMALLLLASLYPLLTEIGR